MKRISFASLLLAALIILVCQPATSQDSARIEKLFDDYFREYLTLNPEAGSQLGLPEESGYYFDQAGLGDISDAGIKPNFDLARKYLGQLKAYLVENTLSPVLLLILMEMISFLNGVGATIQLKNGWGH